MCGIAGILAQTEPQADLSALAALMADRLVHRGPDASGVWADERIALSHRRLAVVDLSQAGSQPMLSACERYVMVFNGEIYNHLDLRQSLAEAGAASVWIGHSDTETLLAAIAHWGMDDALRRAQGMFALAVWDRARKHLSLARDRMGEKPLYWGWAGKDLVFGSELKALRTHPECPREVCREALSQYLRFMYVPAPRSIHPSIYKLEPGTILVVDGEPPAAPPKDTLRPGENYGSLSIRRYWDLNGEIEAGARNPIQDECEAVSMLCQVLRKAVERQMLSDVPLGAFLSGGVDSSAIVALMQAESERPVQTFTIGFNEAAFDESPYAAAVAQHLGTDHTKLLVTDADAREVIPDLPHLYDEPFADSSQIPTHLVCRAARQHVTIALSGDGGDELFGGYNRYILGPSFWQHLSKFPSPIRRFAGRAATALPERNWNKIQAIYNRLRTGTEGINGLGAKAHRVGERLSLVDSLDALHLNMSSIWTSPEVLIYDPTVEPCSSFQDSLPKFGLDHPAMQMMVQDMRNYLPDDILCKVDRAAMGVSLETRAPFLDPDVISLAARLPMEMKIRNGVGKWALRQVLYQHVPRKIIDRPKAGFAIPIGIWLRGPLREWAEDLLSHKRLTEGALFNPDIIRKTWSEHLSGRRDWSARLWTILMFQAWYTAQTQT